MGVKNTKICDKNKPWSIQNCKAERGHIKIPALCLFWLKDILIVSCPQKESASSSIATCSRPC